MSSGYYRYPTIQANTIVFNSEDDLWAVAASGGIPRRLTANLGQATRPSLSPDGKWLAFVGREEGTSEIYIMPSAGGLARRLTFLGGSGCTTAGWSPEGEILFASNAAQPFTAINYLYSVDPESQTGEPARPQRLDYGPASAIAFGPAVDGQQRGVVIGRNTGDPARWKRYRGGTAGQLWIDPDGQGEFHPLLNLAGNLAAPMWLESPDNPAGRIYFISDHEGTGNLYSCLPDGSDLRRHTDHEDYYARNPSSDGLRIVYHAGADIYLYDPRSDESRMVAIEYHSPQVQRNRKFVTAANYMESWNMHPSGQALAVCARGQVFTFANWEGAVLRHPFDEENGQPERQSKDASNATSTAPTNGFPQSTAHPLSTPGEAHPEQPSKDGIRFRLPAWLSDGKRLIAVVDAGGEETFAVWTPGEPMQRITDLDIGRPVALVVNPWKDQVVFNNHRYELICLDLETRTLRLIDRGVSSPISGFDWSPDGEWLAYSVSVSLQTSVLKLWKEETGEITPLTRPVLRDVAPSFDPCGDYLYFLSYRTFDPVQDQLHFDFNFPRGMRPYLISLQKENPNPFIPRPHLNDEEDEKKDGDGEKEGKTIEAAGEEPAESSIEVEEAPSTPDDPAEKFQDTKQKQKERPRMHIDLEGIEQRVVAFPVPEAIYGRVKGARDGKVLYTRFPIEGTLNSRWFDAGPEAHGTLLVYSFDDFKEETLVTGMTDFDLTPGGGHLAIQVARRLRVVKSGEKPNDNGDGCTRKTGWIDLDRVKAPILPGAEWRQMFREAWRLQRDQFWTPDMAQVDWLSVHDRYLPLVDRVSSRAEFSDLMWEMQGELGTSHAYEMLGDYRPEPNFTQGFLGAEYEWNAARGGWRIIRILRGDDWDARNTSPLNGPGINLTEGDLLLAVNGQKLDPSLPPEAALVNLAGEEVALTILRGSEAEAKPRQVTVRALYSEYGARYREWVERNRQYVHEVSSGRLGYLHIPDMGPRGYAEFHRGYLGELERDGLIVDVRFNGGGMVSSLVLEKLARRRIGYGPSRWNQLPDPYPPESVKGAMVALTNEYAGSDGDIFSHGFKLMKLGPLVGKRTWGGVIGISPYHSLVDGTITTQPEYSTWFADVGWGLENYGTDPDIEVDRLPQDDRLGIDRQLDRAIQEGRRLLDENPPVMPDFEEKPNRAAPRLPKR